VRRTKLINGVEFELKICETCGIVRPPRSNPNPSPDPNPNPNPNPKPKPNPNQVRPPRSSHDSKTGRCVLKFDHFCIFLGNTVGTLASNRNPCHNLTLTPS